MTLTVERNRHGGDHARASVQVVPGQRRLSRPEECHLSALIDEGELEARNRLVQANLGLVVTIARQFTGRGLDLDDLVGEGNLGRIRAAKGSDPRTILLDAPCDGGTR